MFSSVITRGSSVSLTVDGESDKTYEVLAFTHRAIDLHLVQTKKGIQNGSTVNFMDLLPETVYTFNMYPERIEVAKVIIWRKPSDLAIATFQIFNGDIDVTENGTATQSSTTGSRSAHFALDGNPNTYAQTLNKNKNQWIYRFKSGQEGATSLEVRSKKNYNVLNNSTIEIYDTRGKLRFKKVFNKRAFQRVVIPDWN
jgi:hypothetical protein